MGGDSDVVVGLLLSLTFACGLVIAVAHVINRRFVAPAYDVLLNLTAFASAVAASLLLDHWIPATLSAVALMCWLGLARRTYVARGPGQTLKRKRSRGVSVACGHRWSTPENPV